MNKTFITWIGIAIAIILSVVALVGANQSALVVGGEGDSNFTNLVTSGDVTAGDDLVVTDDLTVSGGAFTVTTTNTATSTIIAGCFQTTSTSTASYIELVPFATSTAANGNSLGAFNGYVMWSYGTCP